MTQRPSPAEIERAEAQYREVEAQLRELQARLDPDGVPVAHPWRIAARNSGVTLVLIGVAGAGRLFGYRSLIPNVAWWVWVAISGLVVAVCFGHAALGLAIGRRKAANFLKIVLAALLVGIVVWLAHLGDTVGR